MTDEEVKNLMDDIDNEEEEDEVESEVFKHCPATEPKHLPKLLEACSTDPDSLEPEAFAQLEQYYEKALNQDKCPCQSSKVFSECCKPIWQVASRGWKNREDESKRIRKEQHKDQMAAESEAEKAIKDTNWIVEIGVINKTGEIMIRPSGKENRDKQIRPSILRDLLMQAWTEVNEEMCINKAIQTMMHINQEVMKQKMTEQGQQKDKFSLGM